MRCYGCGDEGHIEPNCPNAEFDKGGKPPWCGVCDQRTRLVDLGGQAGRCTACHPHRREQLRQHRKCPSCHVTVYEWDHAPCGQHAGPDVPDKRPHLEHIQQIVSTA